MGGLAGHLSHVYEDLEFKFIDIVEMFDDISNNRIVLNEKVDGQNIFFRWCSTSNSCKFARNKKHAALGGTSRVSLIEEFMSRCKDENYKKVIMSFNQGMLAIENTFAKQNSEFLANIFEDTQTFVNCEIMSEINRNLVVYNGNFIVLHNMINLNDNFTLENKFKLLVDNIDGEIFSNWKISGPITIKANAIACGLAKDKLSVVLEKHNLTINNSLADYVHKRIMSECLSLSYKSRKMVADLVTNKPERPRSIKNITKIDPNQKDLITALAGSKNKKKTIKYYLLPIIKYITDVTCILFNNVGSPFMKDKKLSLEILRNASSLAVNYFKKSDLDPTLKSRFETNMKLLGCAANITSPIEGVVFTWKGRFLKLTGTFAPVNQILSLQGFEIKDKFVEQAMFNLNL